MASSDIQLLSELDCAKITFSEPKHQKGRASQVYLNYDGGRMPLVQTHLGAHAYKGISAFENPDNGKFQYSIDLAFKGDAGASEQIEATRRAVEQFDEFLVKSAATHSREWFRKKLEPAAISALHTPWLKIPKDKDTGEPTDRWPPTIKLKLPTTEDDNDFRFPIYHIRTAQRIPPPANLQDYVPTGSSMRAILKCGGLWIANGRFGCTWYVEQLQLAPSARLTECAFRTTGEEMFVKADEVDLDGGATVSGDEPGGEIIDEDSDVIDSDNE